MNNAVYTHYPRFEDWPQRLEALLQEWATKPFVWGETDCFCFAGAAIESLTGGNPMAEIMPQYDTEAEAYHLLGGSIFFPSIDRSVPMGGMERFWSFFLGDPQPVGKAQRGDLVLLEVGGTGSLAAIIDGSGKAAAAMTERRGVLRVKKSLGYMSWRV